MKLIVGLGNPGSRYEKTRHNIGFMCVNFIARRCGISLNKKQNDARVGTGQFEGTPVVLARPQTGMNVSGESVAPLARRYKIKPEDVIVIYDDIDLPSGKIRLRYGGNSGGHNGISSVIAHIGTRDFYRVRVGIGRPDVEHPINKEAEVIRYVLGDFTKDEKVIIEPAIERCADAVACLITEGITAAMNKFN